MAKPLMIAAGIFFPMACSNPADAGARDQRLIVPEDLEVTALAGGNGVLDVIALSLVAGSAGTEVYAALRNVGEVPACSAAFSIELFDDDGQSLAAGINGLLSRRFYRLDDGSGSIAACVGPGDVTMTAVLDLPKELVAEDVASIVYRCPYFALDVTPIDGLDVRALKPVTGSEGTAYAGELVNRLDVAVRNPSVTVFPLNAAGRPLGVAIGSGDAAIAPGEQWAFETNTTSVHGVDSAAYPAGELAGPSEP